MDRTNREILLQLSRDARLSWQELGRRVHLTGQAVATRVQLLLDSGVIRRRRSEWEAKEKRGTHPFCTFHPHLTPM